MNNVFLRAVGKTLILITMMRTETKMIINDYTSQHEQGL